MLRGLVATDQKQYQIVATLRVVNAIPGTMIDLHFRHATSQSPVLARVAHAEAPHAHIDAGPCLSITQVLEPIRVFGRLADRQRVSTIVYSCRVVSRG